MPVPIRGVTPIVSNGKQAVARRRLLGRVHIAVQVQMVSNTDTSPIYGASPVHYLK